MSKSLSRISSRDHKRTQQGVPAVIVHLDTNIFLLLLSIFLDLIIFFDFFG